MASSYYTKTKHNKTKLYGFKARIPATIEPIGRGGTCLWFHYLTNGGKRIRIAKLASARGQVQSPPWLHETISNYRLL